MSESEKKPTKPPTAGTDWLEVTVPRGVDLETANAMAVFGPELSSGIVAGQWCKGIGGSGLALMGTLRALQAAAAKINAGDMSAVEARLLSQATALDVVFAELSRRAAANIGDYPDAFERYLKLALKAQNQSRMTLETLANVKNPPVVYAKQANINNGGHQQVNNDTAPRAPATEKEIVPSKILEQVNEQRLDSRTPGQTFTSNPAMEALVESNRTEDASWQGQGLS